MPSSGLVTLHSCSPCSCEAEMLLCEVNQMSYGAAQSRCLYNVRQAFHTMQADLDPLLKGAHCLPACL